MASHELQGWPKEYAFAVVKQPSPEHFSPERKVTCDWNERFLEADRLDGLEYPYAPGCGAFPVSIFIEPLGGQHSSDGGELASYPLALLTIRYSTSRSTAAAIIEWIEGSEDHESATGRGLAYSGGQVLYRGEHSPVIRSGCVFIHQRNKLATVPAAALTAVDCVNASNVYSTVLGIWFTAEMLRVRVPKISRTWTTGGLTAYSVTQQFVYKYAGGKGWNSVYNNATGQYDYLYNAAGNRVYNYPLSNVVLV
jgi:hypothetical protein